jgi:zinc protease
MNFKGTVNIPREQMKGIVERFGGMWNGYTWIDQTTYLETAGRDALDRMLFIEAERMAYGLYEPGDCESERTVIISELQGGENDPDQLLDTEVMATALRAHPYQHPTIGWLEDLRSMTRDDLVSHYRRFYIPNNATLVVVGDVNADVVLRSAEAHFASIPEGVAPDRIRVCEPPQLGERRVLIERDGTTGYVKVVFHAPAANDPDFFAMLVSNGDLRPLCPARSCPPLSRTSTRSHSQRSTESPWRTSNRRRCRKSRGSAPQGLSLPKLIAHGTSCGHDSCSKTTA